MKTTTTANCQKMDHPLRNIYERYKVHLNVTELKPNDHPLHVFINRKHASALKIPETEDLFYLSMWTNTKLQDGNLESLPLSRRGRGCIFHRMLSNSQNFPEILIPDSGESDDDRHESFASGSDVEIFLCVWVRDEVLVGHVDENPCLRCSQQFIEHYNVESMVLYVRQVVIYPVSNIVLGVGSREAFQWFTTKDFCDRLLKEVHRNPVLVRSKDVFLATYGNFLEDSGFKRSYYFDLYVLECSPVQQGLLSAKTEIVLTYMGDLEAEREKFHNEIELIVSNPPRGQKQIGGPFKDLYISDFTRAINHHMNSPDLDEADDYRPMGRMAFQGKAHAIKSRRKQKVETVGKFEFEVVAQQPMIKRMLWRDQKKQNFDSMYFVGMSRKLMIKEGLFDSSYVLISPEDVEMYEDEERDQPPVERLCMVRCLGKEYDRSKRLFISPLCLFNMVKKPPIEMPSSLIMKRYDITDLKDTQDRNTSSTSWNVQLPTAKEVHISIIPSPNYSPRAPHDEALKQYFSTRRVVAVGDVLAIQSSDDPLFWQNTGDDTENRFPCIYFKVVSIKGKSAPHRNFIMDKDTTSLIEVGTEHSYIPVMMQTFLNTTPQGFWDRDCLPGLTKYVDMLENFVIPHLTTRHSSKCLNSVPPAILVCGPVGSGKTSLIIAVARRLGMHGYKVNCHNMNSETAAATEAKMKNTFNSAGLYSPCILLLQSVHAIGRDRDGNTEDPRVASSFLANVMQLKNDLQQYPVIVVATTHSSKDLTQDMLECFLHQVNIEVPDEFERGEMIDSLLQTTIFSGKIPIPYIAQRTAGFVLGDLAALVAHAKREAFRRIVKLCCNKRIRPNLKEEEHLRAAGIVVQQTDFQTALDQLQAAHSDAIGAPKIPNVKWDDVGGLYDVKTEILDTIQLPLQFPELLAAGLRRSGVLLYGPPGTGKTLLAKAVATECSLNFLSVKGPELINMYVGQSEENVREVFRRARSATPCVIFFDELDSLAPNRGKSGDSGGVMDRVVSQLLSELDGLNKACDVFVIGATNRPDLLDPALLRPGRFDRLLYLGVSEDKESQQKVLEALTRKFKHAPGLDMRGVVEKCPFNLTGADFYALASDAMLHAMKRKIEALERGLTDDQTVVVDMEDYKNAVENLTPSVTEGELQRFKQLRTQFSGTN